jgi:hypothetical protein
MRQDRATRGLIAVAIFLILATVLVRNGFFIAETRYCHQFDGRPEECSRANTPNADGYRCFNARPVCRPVSSDRPCAKDCIEGYQICTVPDPQRYCREQMPLDSRRHRNEDIIGCLSKQADPDLCELKLTPDGLKYCQIKPEKDPCAGCKIEIVECLRVSHRYGIFSF